MCEADRQGQRRLTLSSNPALPVVQHHVALPTCPPARLARHMDGGHIGDSIGFTTLRTERMWGAHVLQAQERTSKLEAPSQQSQP